MEEVQVRVFHVHVYSPCTCRYRIYTCMYVHMYTCMYRINTHVCQRCLWACLANTQQNRYLVYCLLLLSCVWVFCFQVRVGYIPLFVCLYGRNWYLFVYVVSIIKCICHSSCFHFIWHVQLILIISGTLAHLLWYASGYKLYILIV